MSLKLNSSGGGSVTLQEPVTASARTVTVPDGDGALPLMKLETAKASLSGTSIDFTGIPSWVKRITVMFGAVSTNGTSALVVQIGDAGGVENTGYADTVGNIATSTASTSSTGGSGFAVANVGAISDAASGVVTLTNVSGNIWALSGSIRLNASRISYAAGAKTLSDTLDRVRITTFNGTDTFDSGSINILYEG